MKGQPQAAKQNEFGATEEEQKKGFLRSIFGYFRGPRKGGEKSAAADGN